SHQLCSSDVKANPLFEFDRLRRRAKHLKMAIEHRGWREKSRRGQDHSALHLGNVNTLQVHRGSLAGPCLSGNMAVNLNTTNTRPALRWEDFDFLFFLNAPGDECPSNNRSKTFHRETAVYRQTKDLGLVFRSDFGDLLAKRFNQFRNTFPSIRTDAQYWRMLQE